MENKTITENHDELIVEGLELIFNGITKIQSALLLTEKDKKLCIKFIDLSSEYLAGITSEILQRTHK
jgi:hypothetical protein